MMRRDNGPGRAQQTHLDLFLILVLMLTWIMPWREPQGAPAYRAQTLASATSNTLTLNKPAGAVHNDLLLATLSARGNTTITPPSGWQLVQRNNNGSTETLAVYYRLLNNDDASVTSYTFNLSASVGVAGAILRYTGADSLSPIDVSAIGTGTSATPTAPAVTTTVADTSVVRIAGVGDNTLTSVPATSRVSLNYNPGGGGSDVALGASDGAQSTAGTTGTAAFNTSESDPWVTATLALRPLSTDLCANPPSSGTTTMAAGTYNTYYPGTATASAGAVSISVGTARGASNAIAAGDLLLVIQMQDATINASNTSSYGANNGTGSGATNYNNAGLYEFVLAKGAVSGGSVPIEGKGAGGGLINTYTHTAAATATQGQRRFQVIRVPQYYDATVTGAVTAAAWNGSSGGIVALDVANTLTFSGGSINVNALGFRGGGGQQLAGGSGANTDHRTRTTVNTNGNKGEGVAGSPNAIYDGTGTLATGTGYPDGANADTSRARGAPGNAGGGGTDDDPANNDENSGGGGGGNGGAGGLGGYCWGDASCSGRGIGGAAFPYAPSRLAMGGGGGSGSRNNSTGVQSSGGLGGGLILIRANSITGTASLSASGGWPATDNYTPENDGAGGGGAGGSVLVLARTGGLTSLTVTAQGGIGANAWPTQAPNGDPGERHGPGGGGAGGVIYLSSAAGSISATGGTNGTTTTALSAFGATPGASGAANATLSEGQIPGVISGATCKATLAGIARFGASVEGGRVIVSWETNYELGTVGFHLERLDPILGTYQRVNQTQLPALFTSPLGGRYSLLDPDARPEETYSYRLIEREVWGGLRVHGPYRVTPVVAPKAAARAAPALAGAGDDSTQEYEDPTQGYRAIPHPPVTRGIGLQALAPASTERGKQQTGAAQIPVRKDGLVFASSAQLAQALGAAENEVRRWIRKGKLALTTAGQDVAWAPGREDGILFYGEAIDSLYALDNVYRVRSNQQGQIMERSPSGQPVPEPVTAGTFAESLRVEEDRFAATLVTRDPEGDYWYWEGFIGGKDPRWSTRGFSLDLPDASGGGSLGVFLKGAGPGGHRVQVSVNGESLGEGIWSDLADFELRLPLADGQIHSGENRIEVRALGGAGDLFYLDRFEVSYRRLARALDGALHLQAEQDGPLAVEGFGTGSIRVFDITDAKRPLEVTAKTRSTGAVAHSVTFLGKKGRRYLTLTGEAITTAVPAPMSAAGLSTARNRADYLVIAPPGLREAAQRLADYRRSTGLLSRVVSTEEIYDTYNEGVASPHAIRDFLRQAQQRWGVHSVVLLGVGSFDYRDLWDLGEPQVPTLMTPTPFGLYSCDNCLADLDGDGAPDLAIGRIPATSAADLETYLGKLRAYEDAAVRLPEAGALLLADRSDPTAGHFAQDSEWVAEVFPPHMGTIRIYLDEYGIGPARSLLFAAMNQGTGWVNYIGHGGMDGLSAQRLLTVDDLALLRSTGPLPVLSALTCAANRFEVPGFAAVGEELILDGDGGAVAVWAPTGLSLNEPAVRLNRSLLEAVLQQGESTLGAAVQRALQRIRRDNLGPAYLSRIYALLGDPALRLTP